MTLCAIPTEKMSLRTPNMTMDVFLLIKMVILILKEIIGVEAVWSVPTEIISPALDDIGDNYAWSIYTNGVPGINSSISVDGSYGMKIHIMLSAYI